MSLVPTLGLAIDFASGVLLVGLAAWVASRRPDSAVNAAFAGFSALFGLSFIVVNLVAPGDPAYATVLFGAGVLWLLAAIPLGLLAVWFPRPLARDERPLAYGAATLALVGGAVYLGTPDANIELLLGLMFLALIAGFVFTLALFALRAARAASREPGLVQQYALMAAALGLYPAFFFGINAGPQPDFQPVALVGILVAIAGLWLRTAALARTPGASRAARNAALLLLAFAILGVAAGVVAGDFVTARDSGLSGITRAATVLLLAYAILRHQVLGLDLKVRWTIKQSTVAAAFVGVFFVVSEGAQSFFASTTNSSVVGIVAAGALVFAIAPIQRAAERVAEAAVPGGEAPRAGRAEELYRTALRIALRDGRMTREEELDLAEMAERLGLGARRVMELRAEVGEQVQRSAARSRPGRGR